MELLQVIQKIRFEAIFLRTRPCSCNHFHYDFQAILDVERFLKSLEKVQHTCLIVQIISFQSFINNDSLEPYQIQRLRKGCLNSQVALQIHGFKIT